MGMCVQVWVPRREATVVRETGAQRTKESGLQRTILGSLFQDAVVPHGDGVSRGGAATAAEGCRAGGSWVERWETSGMSRVIKGIL